MKVLLVCGISGSGKTTYVAGLVKADPRAVVVSADRYFYSNGKFTFEGSKLSEAHGRCLIEFAETLQGVYSAPRPGDMLVVDNCNSTTEEMAPYIALAQAYGAELEIVTLKCEPRKAYERGEHSVPLSTNINVDARLRARRFPPRWFGIKHTIIDT